MKPCGFVNILKPPGYTSSDVVVKVRRILSDFYGAKTKAGHLGTLDPQGAGVLPVAFGNATRLFEYFLGKQKTYIAGVKLGKSTDTLDSYGRIVSSSAVTLPDDIGAVLQKFKGKSMQYPPSYSAKSVNGVRAYDLARKGEQVCLAPREIAISDISLLADLGNGHYVIKVTCSAGTYIRSLARDIAAGTGNDGYMSFIIRTASGTFDIADSITIDEFAANPQKGIIPITAFADGFARAEFTDSVAVRLLNGVGIRSGLSEGVTYAVYTDGELAGLGSVEDGNFKINIRF